MPPKGWKSITLPIEVYNFFYERWQREKTSLRIRGIRSFSAYISYILSMAIEEYKKKQAEK
ncbi:MAG: hypothetical protein QW445_08965 [Candidatus Bathyarchaeia archaeon]